MPIIPGRLRELRIQSDLTREELELKSKISARQIARIESQSASSSKARERTTKQLAYALAVEPGVLTGELPMPKRPRRPDQREPVQMSALMRPEARLAYTLIKRFYGVNTTAIVNMAPLFFVLLAEASLKWRREMLEEVYEAGNRLEDLGHAAGHLSFAFAVCRGLDCGFEEQRSIEKRDLFGKDVAEDTFEFGYDRSTSNPFADFLRELAKRIDNPDLVKVDPFEAALGYPSANFPEYVVCGGELKKITGGSGVAERALSGGHVQLSDIPDELWAEDAAADRVKWLESKNRELPPDLEELLNPLDDESSEAGK